MMTLEDWLIDEINKAEASASASASAPNSYGAGYDTGYANALRTVLNVMGPVAARDNVDR
jgi:hypothetical protein